VQRIDTDEGGADLAAPSDQIVQLSETAGAPIVVAANAVQVDQQTEHTMPTEKLRRARAAAGSDDQRLFPRHRRCAAIGADA
jgi:hypothetical protein